ncbi:MAG: geranylgeranyl reductase family protein [Cyclobacteriaceae bacterium]
MKKFDLVIIGSGPSGSMAAQLAASKKLSVAIIEKAILPRYKTCGGGLVFRGRNRISLNISETIEKEFKEIDVYFENTNLHFRSQRDVPIISLVMRDKFDALLTQKAIKEGVTMFENTCLKNINFEKEITLTTSRGEIKTEYVIGADGALSPTAKLGGWKETRRLIPALEYEIKVSTQDWERLSKNVRFDVDAVPFGYAWCFPKANHLSIGVCSFKKQRIDLKYYYKKYLDSLGIREIGEENAHGFQIPITPRTDGFVKNNLFLVGDAAGFADPLTAEGISNALFSGQLAAKAISQYFGKPKLAAAFYEQDLKEKLLPELKTSGLLSWIFYSQPKFRNLLIQRYGQRGCEILTDIFLGKQPFPKDIKKKLLQTLPLP